MHHRRALRVASALLMISLGCAAATGRSVRPESAACDDLLRNPQRLRERAEAELEARQFEFAYRYLALIGSLHPDSRESAEVFPQAAALFQKAYFENRYTRPDSLWLTSEPVFLFDWLSRFYGEESPEPQASVLFVGMPFGIFRAFTDYAANRPALSGWVLRAEKDNGIIVSITAEPAAGRPGA